jgi:hypothetical protein
MFLSPMIESPFENPQDHIRENSGRPAKRGTFFSLEKIGSELNY